MVRSFLAVLAGYAAMALVVLLVTPLAAAALVPSGATPSTTYFGVSLGLTLAAALLGGWVAARLAPSHPVAHGAALAGVICLLTASMLKAPNAPAQPTWYVAATVLCGVVGSFGGAWWRARARVAR